MRRQSSYYSVLEVYLFLLFVLLLNACGTATDIKLVSIKKIILIENNVIALKRAEFVTIIPDKKLMLAANLNTSMIGCWNIDDGNLIKSIKLPVKLSDSLYPISVSDEKEGFWIENRKKVSRKRFDWGNDPVWFEHQIKGLSISDDVKYLYIVCDVKGTELNYNESDNPRSELSATPAIIVYDFENDRFLSVKQLSFIIDSRLINSRAWYNPNRFELLYSILNLNSWHKMNDAVDNTFCLYRTDKNILNGFFAKRAYKRNSLFLQGMTALTWLTDTTFLFAHSDDKEIYDQADRPIFKIPSYGKDTVLYDSSIRGPNNMPLLISRFSTVIQNIIAVLNKFSDIYNI